MREKLGADEKGFRICDHSHRVAYISATTPRCPLYSYTFFSTLTDLILYFFSRSATPFLKTDHKTSRGECNWITEFGKWGLLFFEVCKCTLCLTTMRPNRRTSTSGIVVCVFSALHSTRWSFHPSDWHFGPQNIPIRHPLQRLKRSWDQWTSRHTAFFAPHFLC